MLRSRRDLLRLLTLAELGALVLLCFSLGSAQAEDRSAALPASLNVGGSEVWSATLQVGIEGRLLGYGTVSQRSTGELSNDQFSWQEQTFTVASVFYNRAGSSNDAWDVVVDFMPALPDGFECLAIQLGDTWLNLSDGHGNRRQFFWYGIELPWRVGGSVAISLREYAPRFEARAIDGWWNNLQQPERGTAGSELLRRAGTSLSYAVTSLPRIDLPEPRTISNVMADQPGPIPNGQGVTDMIWQWGQFLDHDISLTPAASPPEDLGLTIPRGDPIFDPFSIGPRIMRFERSMFDPDTGTAADNPREQVNVITSFIDASNIYGSDIARVNALRTNDGSGRLRTSQNGRLLPVNLEDLDIDTGGRPRTGLFFSGDIRANEQVSLTAMHTLFVREHNRLADQIRSEHPELSGNEIFELARKIVGAQMQVITYHEFLPLLLGPRALPPYAGYDPEVDPTIANEFSAAAYRVGHTMLSPALMCIESCGEDEQISLARAFFNPSMLREYGISGFLRGLSTQRAQEIDRMLVDEVRNLLFGPPGSVGRDLAALNIQRGRDHGISSYNITRIAYGLSPARGFDDVSRDPIVQAALEEAYGDVDLIDLWIGGLAEDHAPGAMVGETFRAIIADQFQRLRDGDRYWFESDPYLLANPELLETVRATRLADVIRRNTPIEDEISDYVFGGLRPAVSIETEAAQITEGGTLTYRLVRAGVTANELAVDVLLTEIGAADPSSATSVVQALFGIGSDTTTIRVATENNIRLEADSTITASIAERADYGPLAGSAVAQTVVRDDDGVEISLSEGLTSFVWTGRDGVLVGEALGGFGRGDVSERVLAVYEWREDGGTWRAYLPGVDISLGDSALSRFRTGRTYWIRTTEALQWTIPRPLLIAGPGVGERNS